MNGTVRLTNVRLTGTDFCPVNECPVNGDIVYLKIKDTNFFAALHDNTELTFIFML